MTLAELKEALDRIVADPKSEVVIVTRERNGDQLYLQVEHAEKIGGLIIVKAYRR